MTEPLVTVKGIAEVSRALKALPTTPPLAPNHGSKRLREAFFTIAKRVESGARGHAASGSPVAQASAGAIRAQASATGAALAVVPSSRAPAALVAFWGTKKRAGWFADPKYSGYTARDQHLPPWVGNTWGPAWAQGNFSQGPYDIRDAFREAMPDLVAEVEKAVVDTARDMGLDVH